MDELELRKKELKNQRKSMNIAIISTFLTFLIALSSIVLNYYTTKDKIEHEKYMSAESLEVKLLELALKLKGDDGSYQRFIDIGDAIYLQDNENIEWWSKIKNAVSTCALKKHENFKEEETKTK
jgi:hypothetical protein